MRTKTQREMPFYRALKPPKWAPQKVIDSFKSYREAVIWVWQNRVDQGAGDDVDQAICANHIGLHTPHMSRCVNPNSRAPMKLDPDLLEAFEAFCGWNAASQFLAKRKQLNFMEQVIDERRAAA